MFTLERNQSIKISRRYRRALLFKLPILKILHSFTDFTLPERLLRRFGGILGDILRAVFDPSSDLLQISSQHRARRAHVRAHQARHGEQTRGGDHKV